MKQIYQTLKGFRDFLPADKRARDYVENKIKESFQLFGFEPLETPTLEYAELLTGKYGDEADKLLYTFTDRGERKVGLRYDQTVPTARVLAQYQDQLGKGFRRYQIQPVFRADKPQKGRYREFAQCDADIFGSTDSISDAEILAVYYNIYQNLGLTDLVLRVNDRQTLFSTLESFATDDVSVSSIIQSIDKLDKKSTEDVTQELVAKGLQEDSASQALVAINSANKSDNLHSIIDSAVQLGVPENSLEFTPTLARGLDYYTGMIFEGILPGQSGSVGGGGRYDQLIESLGGPSTPAVGFGLGFDRTVQAALDQGLVPTDDNITRALVTIFSPDLQGQALKVARELRSAGINTEVYPDSTDKLGKQLKYANKKNTPFVLVIGEDEVRDNTVTLKNMETTKQSTLSLDQAIQELS
mgnify:FL=1